MFFLFLSRAKPAKTLSHERPPHGVFSPSVLVSILGQFVIHLAVLAAALHLTQPFVNRADPSMHPDGKFTPNVLNSVMFLLSAAMQVTTFVANYRGQPFMERFWDHTLLSGTAVFAYAVLALAVAQVAPPLNVMLELVPLPNAEVRPLPRRLSPRTECSHLCLSNCLCMSRSSSACLRSWLRTRS